MHQSLGVTSSLALLHNYKKEHAQPFAHITPSYQFLQDWKDYNDVQSKV